MRKSLLAILAVGALSLVTTPSGWAAPEGRWHRGPIIVVSPPPVVVPIAAPLLVPVPPPALVPIQCVRDLVTGSIAC